MTAVSGEAFFNAAWGDAPEPTEAPFKFTDGGTFLFDVPDRIPAIWGTDDEVLWPEGEALIIAGPSGVGKTTVAGQIIRGRIGLQDEVLGHHVTRSAGRVLYLAMDRPQQARRALARTFTGDDRQTVADRLTFWKGPPPADLAKNTGLLTELCRQAGADTVVIDSLKDAAVGLSEDEVGARYNRARQTALAAGINVMELHHLVKRGPQGARAARRPIRLGLDHRRIGQCRPAVGSCRGPHRGADSPQATCGARRTAASHSRPPHRSVDGMALD